MVPGCSSAARTMRGCHPRLQHGGLRKRRTLNRSQSTGFSKTILIDLIFPLLTMH